MRGAAIALLAVLLLQSPQAAIGRENLESLRPLVELIELIRENYAGEPRLGTKELVDNALSGMVSSLDSYSEFLDAQRYKDLQEDTRGSFSGIGIEIGPVNGKLTVIAPIEGTPADRAGLLGGDVIAYIDGVPTDDMKIMEAVHRIKGPTGTSVTLTIFREGEPPRDVPIKRAKITPVNIRQRRLGNIGYVAIRGFSQRTSDQLRETVSGFIKRGVQALIIDLRSNPGGLLEEAYLVADMFLPSGREIVSTEGRDLRQRAKYQSTGKKPIFDLPLAVLISERSASGSEIVSGALQDWRRAIILGGRSFGKASVQSIEPVGRDKTRALRMTVAHYYTPKHREIEGVGIVPDIVLPPRYHPPAIRRMEQEGHFKRYAEMLRNASGEVGAGLSLRLDSRALADGFIEFVEPEGAAGSGEGATERILGEGFRRWAAVNVPWFSAEEWDETGELALQAIRIALMRLVKGEEAARRYAVEFDPHVRAATALLGFAGANGQSGASGK